MLFNLVNVSIFFQVFIHKALKDFLYQFVIVYLDNILIFSWIDANHSNHVRLILERLRR
jgi:nicotinamide riboside transporter PnuC